MTSYEGLASNEAQRILHEVGPNIIPEKRAKWLKKIADWIISPVSLMLFAAATLSYIAGKIFDFYFILVLWLINFVIIFWHEKKSDEAIKKLQEKLSVITEVLRDGRWINMPATNIVPGDVLRLGIGEIIPADVIFIKTNNVTVNESVLTGESLPKDKNENDSAYSGAFLSTGLAVAKVTATGKNTYFGKTLLAVEGVAKRSILENDILSIARFLSLISLGAVVILSAVLLISHQPLLDLLTLDLSLIVAGIPVSLPTVMTLIINFGVLGLVKKGAIVRRLSSLEDFSNIDLLLSDKTGTLTKNELSVDKVITYENFTEKDVITFAYAASGMSDKSTIDLAVAKKFKSEDIKTNIDIVDFVPSDSVRKRNTAIASIDNKEYSISVGASQIIIGLAKILEQEADKFANDVKLAADGGYRVLAVARAEGRVEKNMALMGLILISDTPLTDAKETIEFMRRNNIDVKILTGDNLEISSRTAHDFGLEGEVVNRSIIEKIESNSISPSEFEKISVFSEILPSDKYSIVQMAKENHRVAVTGDGANDIPAVKAADVGIAVKNSVDALKSVADIVLLASGISVIKDAIIEARKIFARLYTYALYRISESLRLILSTAILGIIYLNYPMSAIQILILALLNDIPIISLAYDRVHVASKPAKINAKRRTLLGSLYGLTGLLNSLLFVFFMRQFFHLDWIYIQTLFFLKLSVGGHMLIYVAHTKQRWYKFLPDKSVIIATSITQILATFLTVSGIFMAPIKLSWALGVWIWAFFWMQISELVKHYQLSRFEKEDFKSQNQS
jgi:H+-transporting ATPase